MYIVEMCLLDERETYKEQCLLAISCSEGLQSRETLDRQTGKEKTQSQIINMVNFWLFPHPSDLRQRLARTFFSG